MNQALPRLEYDREADVLYVTGAVEPAYHGVGDELGVVWRYTEDGRVLSATILDFQEVWRDHRSALTDRISSRFSLPYEETASLLSGVKAE